MLVFSTQLCELLPSYLLPGSTPPPPHIQTVCGWEGVGVLSPVEGHILEKFNALYLTRFRT
jgi:hypothetical protein